MNKARDTRNMSVEDLAAEGITVAEAVGRADNGGPSLSLRIELAMHEAARLMHEKGIADDASPERVAEILGTDPATETRVGADLIREAKINARRITKDAYAQEQAAQRAAVEAALAAEGQEAEGQEG